MSDARTLMELTAADYQLIRLKKQLDGLPQRQKLLDLRAKQAEVQRKAEQVNSLYHECEQAIKQLQDEEASLKAKSAEAQAQIDTAANYKEVTNLTLELESLARRREKVEFEALKLMERLDKAAEVQAQVQQALEKLSRQDEELVSSFQSEGAAIQKETFITEKLREQLTAALPAELLKRYEQARQAKGGAGAAHLEGSHCSGCRVAFTDGQLAKLTQGPEIGECPHCHRLLVVSGEVVR
ncbi:MAG: hypothetical protein LBR39_08405 [Coriobacteriales bacterium]|jgi:predicted  nucleic acid-binding Zn-ribbon protein|nr:hypothetical protein [Coriobacteriales bacterium]